MGGRRNFVICDLEVDIFSDLGAALTGGETPDLMAVIEEKDVPTR